MPSTIRLSDQFAKVQKILGRPKVSTETIKEIKRLRKQGKSLNQIAKQLKVSYQTVANYS